MRPYQVTLWAAASLVKLCIPFAQTCDALGSNNDSGALSYKGAQPFRNA